MNEIQRLNRSLDRQFNTWGWRQIRQLPPRTRADEKLLLLWIDRKVTTGGMAVDLVEFAEKCCSSVPRVVNLLKKFEQRKLITIKSNRLRIRGGLG
jgi:hypothetical protein